MLFIYLLKRFKSRYNIIHDDMPLGEMESWTIFIGTVAGPLSTIGAAALTALGTIAMAKIIADAFIYEKQKPGVPSSLVSHPMFF
jgi:hypothetical protein